MSIRRPLLRVLLGAALLGGGVLAGTGGLALAGPGLVAVGLAAALAACMAAGIVRESPERARGSVVEAAVWAAGSTLAAMLVVAGIATLAGGAVAGVAVAVGAAVVLVAHLIRGRARKHAVGTGALPATARTVPMSGVVLRLPVMPSGPDGIASLSTGDLGDDWLDTTAALAVRLDPTTRQALVDRREAVLDELERRDPDGFARWLAAAPTRGSNPADFVRGGPARRGPVADTDAA